MSKIDARLTAAPAQQIAPTKSEAKAKPAAAEPAKPAPAARPQTDSLVVSGTAKTAERMRAITREVDRLLDFAPRTSAQADAWLEKGQALHDEGAPKLRDGSLKGLPLKERQAFTIAMRRLEHFLADGPSVREFFKVK